MRAQHLALAQPAVGLLEVALEQEGQLAELAGRGRGAGRAAAAAAGTAACRHWPAVAVRSRAASVGVAGDVPGVEQPEADLDVVGGDRDGLGDVRTEWSSRTPASQIGYQSASAIAAISGRPVVHQDQVEVAVRAAARAGPGCRPRPGRRRRCRCSGGGPPRRGLGGGVPATASASSPASQASSACDPLGAGQAGQGLEVQHALPLGGIRRAGTGSAGVAGLPPPRPSRSAAAI